ncbi:unnamed protein product [Zymoseptoria tritici ST99CH_1E4]|uniref:Uncharacterized protein n=1 Tax=Zymoseptoria tritici ST99CH_1E4 TaxID=1276532 RepID=A0A2H1FZW2_ZYMTR|nr:unnamed protein product [Zymoseptoria tritici ST99CH_1E4]
MAGYKRRRAESVDLVTAESVSEADEPRHNQANEEFVPLVVTAPEAVQLELDVDKLNKRLADGMNSSGFKDPSTEKIRELIKAALCKIEVSEVMIGLSGNMGGGKSATMNSFFGVGKIAREGANGFSCTLSSNKFCNAKDDQPLEFQAEVFFFDGPQRRELLAGLLQDYRRFSASDDSVDADDRIESSPERLMAVEQTLLSLLCNRAEWSDLKSIQKLLSEPDNDDSLLATLEQHVYNSIHTASKQTETVLVNANRPKQLLNGLGSFVTEGTNIRKPKHSLAPMVSLVEYRFKNPILATGASFMDTPGVSDPNPSRRKSAEIHAPKITHALIMVDVSRAGSESVVWDEIIRHSHLGTGRVMLVVTKTDSWQKDGELEMDDPHDVDMANTLQSEMEDVKQARDELKERLKDYTGADPPEAVPVELAAQAKKLSLFYKHKERLLTRHNLLVRNEQVKTALTNKMSRKLASIGSVPIFMVGNKAYQAYLEGFEAGDGPALTLEETGLPELRRHVAMLPNALRLNAIDVRHTRISRMMARVNAFGDQQEMASKGHVVALISDTDNIKKSIDVSFARLENELKRRFLDVLRRHEQPWLDAVQVKVKKWLAENGVTPFLTLMRVGGVRGPGRHGKIDMIEELLQLYRRDFPRACTAPAHDAIAKWQGETRVEIDRHFDDMVKKVQDACKGRSVDANDFLVAVQALRNAFEDNYSLVGVALKNTIGTVQTNTTVKCGTNYIAKEMRRIFGEIYLLRNGDDRPKMQRKLMQISYPKQRPPAFIQATSISGPGGIWHAVVTAAKSEVAKGIGEQNDALHSALNIFTDAVKDDFEETFANKFKPSDEELTLRNAMKKMSRVMEKSVRNDMAGRVKALRAGNFVSGELPKIVYFSPAITIGVEQFYDFSLSSQPGMERVVDRSELLSDASPPPPSPNIDELKHLDQFEYVSHKAETNGDIAMEDEEELDFCLFAPSSTGQVQSKAAVSKIRLASPDASNATPSFVVPSRDVSYYFTDTLQPDERQTFEVAAVSGQDVISHSHSIWPGCTYEWRVLHVKPTKKQRQALARCDALYAKPDEPSESVSKRTRPGKQSRLKIRAKQAVIRAEEEERMKAAELKEAVEKEKRTRRNREKQQKKRSREKAKKAGWRHE